MYSFTFWMQEPGSQRNFSIPTQIPLPWGALISSACHHLIVLFQVTDWSHSFHTDNSLIHEIRDVQSTVYRAHSHVWFVGCVCSENSEITRHIFIGNATLVCYLTKSYIKLLFPKLNVILF